MTGEVVLGIETSCDETAAAVVRGREILSNVVASQVDLHARYGGVVPELASRRHIERLLPVVDEALERGGVRLPVRADGSDRPAIEGIAVTYGPGLVGALAVGVAFAKALAASTRLPLVGVNHLEGHIYANVLAHGPFPLPALALVVSGAHTDLLWIPAYGAYEVLGRTRDDAAGEAFDKAARAMGLGYPGGPEIDRLSRDGDPGRVSLPEPLAGEGGYDFSFSGLKTAVVRALRSDPAPDPADLAASFQAAVVNHLVSRTGQALQDRRPASVLLGGGVAANRLLRQRLSNAAERAGVPLFVPPPDLCTDNAAMIACAGAYRLAAGERAAWNLTAIADLPLATSA
ncbi:MAG: tRNA (adenosine(37)-N6)-threonylcarbamoyltransferase complex transferase subunit TsaD [Armatimonadota bacterium]|nr:tRNA (adenosine(37)-N6)-threonylcarbamoyltransferase complex transferase subunit TsaD [Armatimonadota bacterium]MDR5698197.1 tRNA (adenosine(37)-N6)-threonylcarbamoyltransferase complex transferase subunit TsaD [Armatimonadota bacterium]